MAGLEIIYQNIHIFSSCHNIEEAYFLGAMLCVKPYSYLSCINSFSKNRCFTITQPCFDNIIVTIYFGSVMPGEVYIISMNDLLKIQILCERVIHIKEFKQKKNEEKKNLLPSYMSEDCQLK